jgi:hypothetical protein
MIIPVTPFRPAHFQTLLERIDRGVPIPIRTMAAEINADPSAYIIEGDFKDVTPSTKVR